MGTRGPIPKRDAERRRTNKAERPTDRVRVFGRAKAPATPREWHPVARRLYDSLKTSGQSAFYEPSDWATAFLICESLSRDLKPVVIFVSDEGEVTTFEKPVSGQAMQAYLKGLAALGTTEGERRRMRIEIDHGDAKDDDGPTTLEAYRKARSA